ncbi:AEC family transporter [Candidatus Woesearchaeota archaeon]|nr:AEC family transporter [Candidatus Woesearchaeota archaeon]
MVIDVILPLILIIGLGFFLGKIKRVDINPFVDFLLYVTIPPLIVTSLVGSATQLSNIVVIIAGACFVMLSIWVLVSIFYRISGFNSRGVKLSLIFGNTGHMGLPVALFAFGSVGLAEALVYNMVTSVLIYTVGIYIVSSRDSFKEVAKMPQLYAILLSVILVYFNIRIPDVLFSTMDIVGKATIPLALIILGYKLTEVKITTFRIGLISSIARILGGLAVSLLFVYLLGISGVTKSTIILQSAMPSALMSLLLAQKFRADPDYVASTVFLSTLISLFAIPLIVYFLA